MFPQLQVEPGDLSEVCKRTQVQTSAIQDLPLEILDHIFEFTSPPLYLLDHSLIRGPQSAWSQDLRRKKALVLVCKSWYAVSVARLYENVTFRRCGQICGFRRTLENTLSLMAFVRRIKVDAIILDGFQKVCEEDLVFIFQACTKVIKIDTRPTSEAIDPCLVPYIPYVPTLSPILHYGCTQDHLMMMSVDLRAHKWQPTSFSSLQSLTIDVQKYDYYPYPSATLTFSSLEVLTFNMVVSVPGPASSQTWYFARLLVPNLCELNIIAPAHWHRPYLEPFVHTVKTLLGSYGSQVKYLQLLDFGVDHLKSFLEYCPHLLHLSLQLGARAFPVITGLSHPHIQWLDIHYPRELLHLNGESFPKLLGSRFFRNNEGAPDINLSRELSNPVFFMEDFHMNYPGVHIQYSDGVVSHEIPDDHILKNCEESDDEEWEYTSSSGYSDEWPMRELDHETCFRATLNEDEVELEDGDSSSDIEVEDDDSD